MTRSEAFFLRPHSTFDIRHSDCSYLRANEVSRIGRAISVFLERLSNRMRPKNQKSGGKDKTVQKALCSDSARRGCAGSKDKSL